MRPGGGRQIRRFRGLGAPGCARSRTHGRAEGCEIRHDRVGCEAGSAPPAGYGAHAACWCTDGNGAFIPRDFYLPPRPGATRRPRAANPESRPASFTRGLSNIPFGSPALRRQAPLLVR